MKIVIFLAIAIILQISKNCEANSLFKRCDLHLTPETPREQVCSDPVLDGNIIAFDASSCTAISCINGMPSKGKATPCWPSKTRRCNMDGNKFYEINALNAAGVQLYKTPKRICLNKMTSSSQMGKAAPFVMGLTHRLLSWFKG